MSASKNQEPMGKTAIEPLAEKSEGNESDAQSDGGEARIESVDPPRSSQLRIDDVRLADKELARKTLEFEVRELDSAPVRAARTNWINIGTTIATASLSLFVAILGFDINKVSNEQHDSDDYRQLISALGSDKPFSRTAAAVGLEPFLRSKEGGEKRSTTFAALGAALMDETDPRVVATILSSLRNSDSDSDALPQMLLLNEHARRRFNLADHWATQYGRNPVTAEHFEQALQDAFSASYSSDLEYESSWLSYYRSSYFPYETGDYFPPPTKGVDISKELATSGLHLAASSLILESMLSNSSISPGQELHTLALLNVGAITRPLDDVTFDHVYMAGDASHIKLDRTCISRSNIQWLRNPSLSGAAFYHTYINSDRYAGMTIKYLSRASGHQVIDEFDVPNKPIVEVRSSAKVDKAICNISDDITGTRRTTFQ